MAIQKIITPNIQNCSVGGAVAKCIDWDYNFQYQVMCENNHTSTGKCASRHRAICKWNNKQNND